MTDLISMNFEELELAKKIKSPCCNRPPSHAHPHWAPNGELVWVALRCPWCREEYEVRRTEIKELNPGPVTQGKETA